MEYELRKIKLQNQNELTGAGYNFEYILMRSGWNELPEEKKYGLADEYLNVTFPHCIAPDGNILKLALFRDEVLFV